MAKKTGAPMQLKYSGFGLSKSLQKLAWSIPNERKKTEKKEDGRNRPRFDHMTNEQIIECRTLKEFHAWKAKDLAARYGISITSVVSIVHCHTRPHLMPLKRLDNPPQNPRYKHD